MTGARFGCKASHHTSRVEARVVALPWFLQLVRGMTKTRVGMMVRQQLATGAPTLCPGTSFQAYSTLYLTELRLLPARSLHEGRHDAAAVRRAESRAAGLSHRRYRREHRLLALPNPSRHLRIVYNKLAHLATLPQTRLEVTMQHIAS